MLCICIFILIFSADHFLPWKFNTFKDLTQHVHKTGKYLLRWNNELDTTRYNKIHQDTTRYIKITIYLLSCCEKFLHLTPNISKCKIFEEWKFLYLDRKKSFFEKVCMNDVKTFKIWNPIFCDTLKYLEDDETCFSWNVSEKKQTFHLTHHT